MNSTKNKELFYNFDSGDKLRFGDVINGFINIVPDFNKVKDENSTQFFNIGIVYPRYSVILTPCCTIDKNQKDKIISITPLLEVLESFYDNPYFSEDLVRINKKMKPSDAVPPKKWEKMEADEKIKRVAESDTFALLEYFIYDKNEYLKPYNIIRKNSERIETNYFMINFKHVYNVSYENINNLLNQKLLQLSIPTRTNLRDKIAYYYARVPDEDIAEY